MRIGPNCYLKDCRIDADTEIHPNCVIDRAVVGARSSIGPFARLRPESVLHEEVHIGNFVEVKKSEIGAGSKANHLTYLGDATVGRKVNVGAGTVTVNYDGVNKWRTEIGDGAFVGSGSMLVAPVKVGADANTGAGSTITKDAPRGQADAGPRPPGDHRRLEAAGEEDLERPFGDGLSENHRAA